MVLLAICIGTSYSAIVNWIELSKHPKGKLFWYISLSTLGVLSSTFATLLFVVRIYQDYIIWQSLLQLGVSKSNIRMQENPMHSNFNRSSTMVAGGFELINFMNKKKAKVPKGDQFESLVPRNHTLSDQFHQNSTKMQPTSNYLLNNNHQFSTNRMEAKSAHTLTKGNRISRQRMKTDSSLTTLTADEFEESWTKLPESGSFTVNVSYVPSVEQLSKHLSNRQFQLCAHGVVPVNIEVCNTDKGVKCIHTQQTKIFFYSIEQGVKFLAQLKFTHSTIANESSELHTTFKCTAKNVEDTKKIVQRLQLRDLFP